MVTRSDKGMCPSGLNRHRGLVDKTGSGGQLRSHYRVDKNIIFFSPLVNQVGKLRTSSHLQLRPGEDKAKQFDTYNNTELHME